MSVTRTCNYCGIEFEGNPKARYCKTTHRVLAYRKRNDLPLTPYKNLEVVELKKNVAALEQICRSQLALINDLKTQVGTLNDKLATTESELQAGGTGASPVVAPPVATPPAPAKKKKLSKHDQNLESFTQMLKSLSLSSSTDPLPAPPA